MQILEDYFIPCTETFILASEDMYNSIPIYNKRNHIGHQLLNSYNQILRNTSYKTYETMQITLFFSNKAWTISFEDLYTAAFLSCSKKSVLSDNFKFLQISKSNSLVTKKTQPHQKQTNRKDCRLKSPEEEVWKNFHQITMISFSIEVPFPTWVSENTFAMNELML